MQLNAIPKELLYAAIVIVTIIVFLVAIRVVRGGGVRFDIKKDGISFDFPQSQNPTATSTEKPSASDHGTGPLGDIKDVTVTAGNVTEGNQDISIGHKVQTSQKSQ